VDVELEDSDVLVVEVDKVVGADEEELDVVELVLLEVELKEVNDTVKLEELLEVELPAAVDEVEITDELDDIRMLDELELDWEDVLLLMLELDITTGLILLYMDNRLAPPHYKN
jgi:hypothetical protein